MLKTFRAVLRFIYTIILGILETLKIFNSAPKNVRHSGKIPMIPTKFKILKIGQFGKFRKFSS